MHPREAAVKILYSPEEQARQEIRSYVNEGLKDVQGNAINDFYEAFDVLECIDCCKWYKNIVCSDFYCSKSETVFSLFGIEKSQTLFG